MELERHDPFLLPDEHELEHEIIKPRWWYAQQLKIAGATWDDIAKALGYESGESARTTVTKAKRVRSKEEMEDILDLELDRLDLLQLAQWRMAIHGDHKSAALVLQIMAMRAKYLGLEKKPNEGPQVTNNAAFFIGGSSEEYVEQLQKAREMVFNKVKEVE
jgi:hypothetical protein